MAADADPLAAPLTTGQVNAAQGEAVSHADGPMVVFAGAGSGKTRVITYRIAHLLEKHRVPPYRILAVTFTNKAAQEMRSRLGRLVGPDLAKDLWVGTFHATCARLLRRHHEAASLASKFLVYDDDDGRAVMRRVYKELGIDDKRFPARAVLGRIRKEKQEGRGPGESDMRDPFSRVTSSCFEAYERRLAEANAVDFDDLLLKILHLVEDPESSAGIELRQRFRYVLVDEFQDVNQVQYRIVRALALAHRNLTVVGDDDQSIYRWRGADVTIVRNFRRDYPEARIVKLEQNYRSTANVVAAALGVIEPARDREPKQLWTENEPGEPITVLCAATERDEAAWVVERVRRLLSGDVSADQIAIFYRTHAQSRVLEELMRAERIPYQVVGGFRFFERAEVKNLLSYLRFLDNPRSNVDFLRIVNVPARSIGETTIDKLARFADERHLPLFQAIPDLCESGLIKGPPKRALEALASLLGELVVRARTASVVELADEVLVRSGYKQALEADPGAESEARLLNLAELSVAIAEYEEEAAAAGEPASLSGFLERVSLSTSADEMKDQPKVCLMTVHAAKGLEFSFVFVTGMEEDTFPFRSQDPDRRFDLEEERRLAYVAFTRARTQLFLSHAQHRTIFGGGRFCSPSRFIANVPPEIVFHESTRAFRMGPSRSIDDGRLGLRGATSAPRLAWSQPQRAAAPPARAPGERYIERDEEEESPMFRRARAQVVQAIAARAGVSSGTPVSHRSFGPGVVVDVDDHEDPTATVRFDGWGKKRVKVRFLDLS